MMGLPQAVKKASAGLGTRDSLFLKRIYENGLEKYEERLAAIGFVGRGRVLDAGCGFGQWSFALGQSCQEVIGLDADPVRIKTAVELGVNHDGVSFQVGSIESLSFPNNYFDAVFSYSVIYYTDVAASVRELARVLKPGGRLYICSNGYGWYIYNIICRPNPSPDFDPRSYGLRAIVDTLRYRMFGVRPSPGGSVVTSLKYLSRKLDQCGITLEAAGVEGGCHLVKSVKPPQPFFRGFYAGMECCSEWVGIKRDI